MYLRNASYRHAEAGDLAGRAVSYLCAKLAAVLADPNRSRLEWPLAKVRRQHVHRRLDDHELPVRHETRRTGSPYSLVLIKKPELFERGRPSAAPVRPTSSGSGRRSDSLGLDASSSGLLASRILR